MEMILVTYPCCLKSKLLLAKFPAVFSCCIYLVLQLFEYSEVSEREHLWGGSGFWGKMICFKRRLFVSVYSLSSLTVMYDCSFLAIFHPFTISSELMWKVGLLISKSFADVSGGELSTKLTSGDNLSRVESFTVYCCVPRSFTLIDNQLRKSKNWKHRSCRYNLDS